jgi:hypothetical protein
MANTNAEVMKMYVPTSYDGWNPVKARLFIAQCKTWFTKASVIADNDKFLQALGRLTGRAQIWATPHIQSLSDGTAPWTSWGRFETDFLAHFANANDADLAVNELNRLCQRYNTNIKNYSIAFEAIAERTKLSDDDKRIRYRDGLPYAIQRAIQTSGQDTSTWEKMQTVALNMQSSTAFDSNRRPNFQRSYNNNYRGNSNYQGNNYRNNYQSNNYRGNSNYRGNNYRGNNRGRGNQRGSYKGYLQDRNTPQFSSQNPNTIKCYTCGETGHMSRTCPQGKGKARISAIDDNNEERKEFDEWKRWKDDKQNEDF